MSRALALALLPLIAFAVQSDQRRPDPVAAANALLESLTPELRAKAVQPFEGDYRTLWRYTPATRQGVSWKDFDAKQSTAAHELIKATLSEMGYKRTQDIRTIEQVLSGIENNARRDKDYYVFTIFGEPSSIGTWGWRYEGHHISLNFTYTDGRLVSSTPQFFGSNPAEVQDGEYKGMRMLAKEEDLGIAFLAELSEEQRTKAIIAERAPDEIFTAENRSAVPQSGGIAYSDLTYAQKVRLKELVLANSEAQASAETGRRMEAIQKAGWEKVVFAWMGAPDRAGAHYYRIQGPTFVIEFDNTQNRANHIHLVWRDFEGDFGRDALKEHYKAHKGDRAHGHDH